MISTFSRLKSVHTYLLFLVILFFASCSVTKYIPEGQYLLDQISLKTDSNIISKTNLLGFIRQKPNDPKLGLMIYNMVDNDSSWFKKIIRKIGTPPVIFSQKSLTQSLNEMAIEMKNRGYLNAYVHAVLDTTGQKISVDYHIHEGIPYRIRNYGIRLPNENMNNLAAGIRMDSNRSDSTRSSNGQNRRRRIIRNNLFSGNRNTLLQPGTIFDMTALEQERTRVSNRLRNSGYYLSTIDNLHYWADTALRSNETDLTLILKDTTQTQVFSIEKVTVFSGYDFMNSENYTIVDSVTRNGIDIYYDKLRFLRPNVIADKILIRPGGLFRERAVESTYNLFQSLNNMGRVDIKFKEGNYPDSALLDCEIYLTPGEMHSIQTSLNGTNKAGDLGISADINYGNLNLFNGSELFNIRLNGAYEFVNEEEGDELNHNFYEFGITPSLTFFKFHFPFLSDYMKDRYNSQTQYSLGFNIQQRPQYTRNFFNFNWQFQWSGRNNIVTHTVNLLNVNYVAIPWKSADFQDRLNEVDPLTRYSYENIFTAGSGYSLIYTNANLRQIRQHLYTVRFSAESSGNLLKGIFSLSKATKSENGQYELFNNPFAQYLKGDIDFSETFRLNETGSVAFHTAFGLAYPSGNSKILPFEKRYYAGGPNSVRGWQTRYLGPGSFNPEEINSMVFHVGDIHFILSAEYRYKIVGWLEPAVFVDCGNIWTIKDYLNQPGGLFRWNSFYKEMAVGTGVGLRFDLSFLILRFDVGTRVYDPAKPEGNRYVFLKRNFWNNSAMHIAIGYPF